MQQDLESYRDALPSVVAIGAAALAYHQYWENPFDCDTLRGALHDIGYTLVMMNITSSRASVTITHPTVDSHIRVRVHLDTMGVL